MPSWFQLSLFSITTPVLVLQLFLLWLIVAKSPAEMHSFRFALFQITSFDAVFTVLLGYGLSPKLLLPYAKGAVVRGLLGPLFGPNGGGVIFAIAVYFATKMLCTQLYAVIFRYSAIQQRYVDLLDALNSLGARFVAFAVEVAISTAIALIGYSAAVPREVELETRNPNPTSGNHWAEDSRSGFWFLNFAFHLQQYDAVLGAYPLYNATAFAELAPNGSCVILLRWSPPYAIAISVLFCTTFGLNFAFSWLIFHTLGANANKFSKSTYRMHRQLTTLLVILFCLPILFSIFPVGVRILVGILDVPVPRWLAECALLLLASYSLASTICTLYFVGPFRRHTAALAFHLLALFSAKWAQKLEQRQHPVLSAGVRVVRTSVAAAEVSRLDGKYAAMAVNCRRITH